MRLGKSCHGTCWRLLRPASLVPNTTSVWKTTSADKPGQLASWCKLSIITYDLCGSLRQSWRGQSFRSSATDFCCWLIFKLIEMYSNQGHCILNNGARQPAENEEDESEHCVILRPVRGKSHEQHNQHGRTVDTQVFLAVRVYQSVSKRPGMSCGRFCLRLESNWTTEAANKSSRMVLGTHLSRELGGNWETDLTVWTCLVLSVIIQLHLERERESAKSLHLKDTQHHSLTLCARTRSQVESSDFARANSSIFDRGNRRLCQLPVLRSWPPRGVPRFAQLATSERLWHFHHDRDQQTGELQGIWNYGRVMSNVG